MSALGKLRHSIESLRERQYWAVRDMSARPGGGLCKARFLRIAATREHAPHDRCQPKVTL